MDLTDVPKSMPIVSETLVIKPENQKDITRENQNRNVRFLIPNYVGYFLPSQSNFSFSITMSGRGNPIPSRDAGCHSLFNLIRTYDVTNSHLLEEVLQYNTLVAQKFQYTKTTSVDNYRAEFEGVQPNKSIDQNLYWKPDNANYIAGTVVAPDVAKSVQFSGTIKTDFYDNHQFIPCAVFNGLRTEIQMEDYRRALEFTTGSMGVGSANGVMPKNMNLMVESTQAAHGADPKLNPFTITAGGKNYQHNHIYTATVGGTHIGFVEVTLVDAATGAVEEAKWYCTANGNVPPEAGESIVLGTPTVTTPEPAPAPATITIKAGNQLLGGLLISDKNDEYFIDLGAVNVSHQLAGATSPSAPADITYFGNGTARSPFNILNQVTGDGMGFGATTAFPNVVMPFSVGDKLFITDLKQTTASKKAIGVITKIDNVPGGTDLDKGARIFFLPLQSQLVGGVGNEKAVAGLTGGKDPILTQNYMFSNNLDGYALYVEEADRINGYTPALVERDAIPKKQTLLNAASSKVDFTIKNLQYNVKRVDIDEKQVADDLRAANSSSGYRLDLATTQTRLVNLQALQGPTSQLISNGPNISKALSIISVFLNQNDQISVAAQSLRGRPDNITNYQYDIGSMGLQPQRKVLVEKASLGDPLIQTQHINELIKAVEGFDMELSSLNGVLMNFAVGRQFARNDMYFNLMEAGDLTLKAEYDTQQTFPKLVVHFIHHIRSILVTSGGIQIAN